MNTIVRILLLSILVSAFPAIAQAQGRFKPTGNLVNDIEAANRSVKSAVTGKPSDPTAALPCDFKMLTKLTADNLIPTMKGCAQDVNNQLVSDTERALNSAQAYQGPNGGATGDNDAVNCLKPALAIFQAAAIIPAIPAQPAVMNPDGSVKTPAVSAVPEQDPGPILLYQKYREFTLSGALTSCQAWFNGPINATAAAGVAGAATAIGGAALLAPKL